MTYVGKISNGQIVLPPEAVLPEGAEVEVTPVVRAAAEDSPVESDGPTLAEMFKDFIGIAEGPEDLAENHDHYAHGAPKGRVR